MSAEHGGRSPGLAAACDCLRAASERHPARSLFVRRYLGTCHPSPPAGTDRRAVSSPRGVAPRLLGWGNAAQRSVPAASPGDEWKEGRSAEEPAPGPRGGKASAGEALQAFFPPSAGLSASLLGQGGFTPECYQRRAASLRQLNSWVPVGRGAGRRWRSSAPATFHVSCSPGSASAWVGVRGSSRAGPRSLEQS